MITNEFTVWCNTEGCDNKYQVSVGVNGTKTEAIVFFKKSHWETVKRKWYCPSCYAKYVVNEFDKAQTRKQRKERDKK